jgi:Predicted AAA-ATPase
LNTRSVGLAANPPGVHIQFNEIGYSTNGLEKALYNTLAKQANKFGLSLQAEGYDQQFVELIEKTTEKFDKVEVLIDEYDKSLIDYLEKEELPTAFAHQKILNNFYSILKSADPYIELLLITGVSKFSKGSVFSDLNNLTDITLDPSVSDLTGYTQLELEDTFA